MTRTPLVRLPLATEDVDDAISFYLTEAGAAVALGFVAALESAYETIAAHPAAGSPRYAHELGLPGVRALRLRGYPYVVFYLEHDDRIDIWRVLHGARDIPAWLAEDQPEP